MAFWGGAVPGNVNALPELHAAGVVGFKCFLLPSGVPEFAPLDLGQLHEAMAMIASFGSLLIAHAEDAQLIENAPQPSTAGSGATTITDHTQASAARPPSPA